MPVSDPCIQFVECIRALDQQRGTATTVVRYLPEGGCWGSAAGAELRTGSCERGIDVLRESYPGLSCGGAR